MISWIVVIVFANISLIACSVMEIQTESTHRRAASLFILWIFQAIIICLAGVFWCCMAEADNRRDQKDEKRDIESGTTWRQPSTREELYISIK